MVVARVVVIRPRVVVNRAVVAGNRVAVTRVADAIICLLFALIPDPFNAKFCSCSLYFRYLTPWHHTFIRRSQIDVKILENAHSIIALASASGAVTNQPQSAQGAEGPLSGPDTSEKIRSGGRRPPEVTRHK